MKVMFERVVDICSTVSDGMVYSLTETLLGWDALHFICFIWDGLGFVVK